MREAIGGTWLFGIVILFIALFASFLAYSISYTRAFNIKNEIINLIERNEGFTKCNRGQTDEDPNGDKGECDVKNMSNEELENNKSVESQAYYKIIKAGYNYSAGETIDCRSVGHDEQEPWPGGYCITKYCQKADDGTNIALNSQYSTYYKVTTFIALRLPVVDITFNIPISGETRTIYYDSGDITTCSESGGE